MNDPQFIGWAIENGLAIVRFNYAPSFRFEDYDVLEAEVNAVADTAEIRGLIINLDALEYLTSRMLGILTAVASRMRKAERLVAVCRLRPEALRAFKLTRLDSVIPHYLTEEEARQALSGP
jgi:anti-anti-sigma factor